MTHGGSKTLHRRGFTMIEIVLVLVIISIALAMAAPSLRGWGQGAKLRDAGLQFVSAARWARTQAISTAMTHVIELDAASVSYVVKIQKGTELLPVAGELGRPTVLPEGYKLSLGSGGQNSTAIVFYPDGRATPAVVRFTSTTGDTVEVSSTFPADMFKLVPAGGLP